MVWRIILALVIVLAAFAGSTWVGSTGLLHTLGPVARAKRLHWIPVLIQERFWLSRGCGRSC